MERQMGVYMLLCGGGTLYTGWTNDLERRLSAHMSGRGCKYTASHLSLIHILRRPFCILQQNRRSGQEGFRAAILI